MKKNSWFRFLILQCCAVTVSVSQLKVSAVMEQVAQGFSISMGAAAGLMSFSRSPASCWRYPERL